MFVSLSSSTVPYLRENPLSNLVHTLLNAGDNRLYVEKQLQLALNRGLIITQGELELLQEHGYSISHHPNTIARFRDFQFSMDVELQDAVRSATPKGGLLIDKFKMYRPGPISIEGGAAKGYEVIFSIFEGQTSEKERIGKEVRDFIQRLENHLPEHHAWLGSKTILDVGCGNGVQIEQLCKTTDWKIIGIDNQAGCIERCNGLLPEQTFVHHNLFDLAPDELKNRANIIFVSHVYCSPKETSHLVQKLQDYRASSSSLFIFVNGCKGSDGDHLAHQLPFLRGKPSSQMSEDFEKALTAQGYTVTSYKKEAQILFPPLMDELRALFKTIKRGDYENPYLGIDPNFKIFKALMEFIASSPLEAMTQDEINTYLDALVEFFKKNGGPHLKICNQMIFAHSNEADIPFIEGFKKAHEIEDIEAALSRIREKMNNNFLEEAKSDLGKFLEPLWRKDHEKTLEGLELMSDLCLKAREYPEAAAILWYAKRYSKGSHDYDAKLDAIEKDLLISRSKRGIGPLRGCKQSQDDKERLQKIRKRIKAKYDEIKNLNSLEKVKELRSLYQLIAQDMKGFIHNLTHDIIDQLEGWEHSRPCEFAILGLGSLVREEMTPYSDFEFAILIESDEPAAKDFFRLLSALLYLRFINLGETILPCLDISDLRFVFDESTPRGLSFDGGVSRACKTALGKQKGRKGDYELIQTPLKMSNFQLIQASDEQTQLRFLEEYHLPTVLSSVTYVTGSNQGKRLISEYQETVDKILKSEERIKRALHLIRSDLSRFKPNLEEENNGKHYNVKQDLYRLPNTMFDGLAQYFCLKSSSTWDRIEELVEREVLSKDGAQDLKEFTMLSQELRLATYLGHGKQKELLDLEKHEHMVFELYYRAFPFVEAMEAFCKTERTENAVACLYGKRFYRKTTYDEGVIHFRHMQYRQAEICLEKEPQDIPAYQLTLAALKNTLGKYSEAEAIYLALIEKDPTADLYLKLGEIRQSLVQYKNAEEVFYRAEKLYKEKNDLKGLEKLFRILGIFYNEYGDINKSINYLAQAQTMIEKRIRNIEINREYNLILDLDLAKIFELQARVFLLPAHNFEIFFKLLQQARDIYRGFYQREDHPKIVDCDYLIARKLSELGKYDEALDMQTKALELRKKLLGEKKPVVALSYYDISRTLIELGRYEEAYHNQTKALEMRIELFGKKHRSSAASYAIMGVILSYQEKLDKAKEMCTIALNIRTELFGENHLDVAISYNDIGGVLGDLGEHKQAYEMKKRALKIRKNNMDINQPDIATSYSNIGVSLENLGFFDKALNKQMKALKIRKNILVENHPELGESYSCIGVTLGKLQKYQEAFEMSSIALKVQKKQFGENHPLVATSFHNVGSHLMELSKHQEALYMFSKALEIEKKLFGENHQRVGEELLNLSLSQLALGEETPALINAKQALSIFSGLPSYKFHPDLMTTHQLLSNIYCKSNDKQKYLEHQNEAKKIKIFIDNQEAWQKSLPHLQKCLLQKSFKKAFDLIKRLDKDLKGSPEVLTFLLPLSLVCDNQRVLKSRKLILTQAECALKDEETPSDFKIILIVHLVKYWIDKKEWDKALKNLMGLVQDKESIFTYRSLDIAALGEDKSMVENSVPFHLLANYLSLIIFERKSMMKQVLERGKADLLKKLNECNFCNHKIDQMKKYCVEEHIAKF